MLLLLLSLWILGKIAKFRKCIFLGRKKSRGEQPGILPLQYVASYTYGGDMFSEVVTPLKAYLLSMPDFGQNLLKGKWKCRVGELPLGVVDPSTVNHIRRPYFNVFH